MIVYNVQRRFFDMKNDAEAYRKEHGGETIKLVIEDRKQLMFLLNGIMDIEAPSVAAPEAKVHDDGTPDYVPKFLKDSWAKFYERNKISSASSGSNPEP